MVDVFDLQFHAYVNKVSNWTIAHFLRDRYLSLGNLKDANILVDEIKKQTQSTEIEFPKTDLMQFINFLLQTWVVHIVQ